MVACAQAASVKASAIAIMAFRWSHLQAHKEAEVQRDTCQFRHYHYFYGKHAPLDGLQLTTSLEHGMGPMPCQIQVVRCYHWWRGVSR